MKKHSKLSKSHNQKQSNHELDDGDENDDEDSENLDSTETKEFGYCHFNANGSDLTFSIELFGITLVLDQKPDSKIGHGAVVWDASVVFSKYVEKNPSIFSRSSFENKSVIELGSGCGLGGLCLMLKGSNVLVTDLPEVIEQLTINNIKVCIIILCVYPL